MKIRRRIDTNGFKCYVVNDEYIVDCLDGRWRCECSSKYLRDKDKHCKHIKEIQKFLDKFINK